MSNVSLFSRKLAASLSIFAGALTLTGCAEPRPVDDEPTANADAMDANEEMGVTASALVTLPVRFDIQAGMTPVKNAGARALGSVFASTALAEALFKKAGLANPDFSEQYLQWSTKAQLGESTNSNDSDSSDNLTALSRYGVPVESAWAYESRPWTATNDPACTGGASLPTKCYTNGSPPSAAIAARKYKLSAPRAVTATAIKGAIFDKKTPVAVDMAVFYQAWNHRDSTLPVNTGYFGKGYVLFPNAADVTASGRHPSRHSVLIVGWDDSLEVQTVDAKGNPVVDAAGRPVKEKGFYLVKNSWGTSSFGATNSKAAGYGWLSYRYVNQYGAATTADTAVSTP